MPGSATSRYSTLGPVPASTLRAVRSCSARRFHTTLSGSWKSPGMIASVGQTTAHAGASPRSVRCTQKWHFSAMPLDSLMYSASYGQPCRQALQPMQACGSMSTTPSGRFSSARTGQISMHGAFVHWLQRNTAKERLTLGKVPCSVYLTQVRKLPRGTSFSALHAIVQAWQPMHSV